jgi:protein O-mannosyl-transferase
MSEPRTSALVVRKAGPAAIILLAAFAAYWPTLHNGFIWDDDYYIQNNVALRTPAGLQKIWFSLGTEPQYYPLTHTSFWVEYQLWGDSPLGYHLDNILLHAAGAIVLWRVLIAAEIPGAWVAALLFCVHPIQVESVAWATERKNVLSGFFYFLSAWSFLHALKRESDLHWGWYAAAIALYIASLLSKSVTATLPAAILLILWLKYGAIRRRDLLALLPLFLAAAAMGALTATIERHHVGAIGPDFPSHFSERLIIAGRAVWFYLAKIFWPVKLAFIYPRWNDLNPSRNPRLYLYPISVLALIALLWLPRRWISRGPLVAFLFFVGTLTPALGFVNVFPMRYSYVADHFQYLACIGPLALFAAIFARLKWQPIALAVVPALCFLANRQCLIYQNPQTLWADTISRNPNSWMVHLNYGKALQDAGDQNQAEGEYFAALALRPRDGEIRIQIGIDRIIRGDYPGAIWWFQQSLQYLPDTQEQPLHQLRAEPYYRLGWVYGAMADDESKKPSPDPNKIARDRQAAIDSYRMAIQILPTYELAMVNLGALLMAEGQTDDAIEQFTNAIAVNPDSINGRNNLAEALVSEGSLGDAMAQYQQVLRIQPENVDAINGIGVIFAEQHDWLPAITQFQIALKLDPNFDMARRNLHAAEAALQNPQ